MSSIFIGIHAHAEPERFHATLASLFAHTALPFDLVLLGDGPDDETRIAFERLSSIEQSSTAEPEGVAACFNRLVQRRGAEFYVLLESGVRFGDRWLENLISALECDPRRGLAGPSTNRGWNEQCIVRSKSDSDLEIANLASTAARQGGADCRTLEPLYSLSDFCYVVRREVVDRIGAADEGYGLGPCWEMDYNIRAHRVGFEGVWVRSSYVHRAPPTDRQLREERDRFEASRRRYQDRFCGLHLNDMKQDYRAHCRGDACPNFAPASLIALATAPRCETEAPVRALRAPLVSCIMPTWNRRAFIPASLACFFEQDYPNLELIVVDDGSDRIDDLLPADARIRYIRLEQRLNIGTKRNVACSHARGEFIAHWDDDDWYPTSRIRCQVLALQSSAAAVTGTSTNYFYEPAAQRGYRYAYTGPAGDWLAALVYRKTVWETHRFESVQVGEDVRFLAGIPRVERLDLRDPALIIASIHDRNTSPRVTRGPYWSVERPEKIRAVMRDRSMPDAPAQGPTAPLVSCIMPTFNRRRFIPLALACFRSQTYPNKELVAIDDGSDPVADMLQAEPDVRYIRLDRRVPVGTKRNLACAKAGGEFIAHWDDDDWYSPERLTEQMRPLLARTHDGTALANNTLLEMPEGRFWTVSPSLQQRMCYGGVFAGTLVFPKSLWRDGIRYPDISLAEDARFLRNLMSARKRLLPMDARSLFVYMRHQTNTWKFWSGSFLDPSGWQPASAPPGFSNEILEAFRSASVASYP